MGTELRQQRLREAVRRLVKVVNAPTADSTKETTVLRSDLELLLAVLSMRPDCPRVE